MLEKLRRIDFTQPNITPEIIVFTLLIWISVLGCVIWSILEQPKPKLVKTFWIAVVVCLPLLGVLLYLPFSLSQMGFFPFFGFGIGKKS